MYVITNCILIGYKLAEKENLPQLESGLIGLLSYLAVCPNTISTVVEGLKDPVVVNGLGAGVIEHKDYLFQ